MLGGGSLAFVAQVTLTLTLTLTYTLTLTLTLTSRAFVAQVL